MRGRILSLRLAGLVFAWLAALSVVAWLVLAGRTAALDRGERATAAFASVVEQQTARTFQAVYLTLGAVGDAQQLSPHPEKNDADFRQMMQRRLQDVPFVRAIFIVGPDGWIIHDTDYPNTPRVPLTDRPYFSAYRSGRIRGETAWPPLLSRSGTGWFLPVTRSLGRSAAFQGVVVAALQAQHLADDFKRIGLGDGYLVTLLHADGTLVASYPARDEVGKSYPELALFSRSPAPGSGSFWTRQGIASGERIVSYRRLEDAPFIVRVSRGKDDVLAEWRRTATGAAVAMLALTGFLGWFIAGLARDSARRQREREQRMQAEKMEALGQLTSGLAHDLGNLLNVVSLNVAALRALAVAPQAAEALATLERALRGGQDLVNRLLGFARRRPITPKRLRLDEWLEAARPLLAQAAGSRVDLSVEAQAGLPAILCDSGELDAALVNLVVNARDAMAGSGRIEVSAFAVEEESGPHAALAGHPRARVRLTVRDDGPGMTEETRRRALEPFYSTKGEAGTGLGLPQVYGFMQQLGGSVSIESAPGRGTAVHLYFPVA